MISICIEKHKVSLIFADIAAVLSIKYEAKWQGSNDSL